MHQDTTAQQARPPYSAPRSAHRPARRPGRRGATAALVAVAVAAGAALTACGSAGGNTDGTAPSSAAGKDGAKAGGKAGGKRLLWLGDSIAGAEAPALGAALKAGGVKFRSAASDGGGTVIEGDPMAGQIAASTWKDLAKDIDSFHPDVIAYQITTYDWGTPAQQRASYEKLARTARDAGAELVIVSAPPFKVDDFYKKYEGAIASAPKAAAEVADRSGGAVRFLDASALWGTDPEAARAQRSGDGIHSCQQGSAAFAKWFTERLGKVYGFTPAAPEKWATGSWTSDARFGKLGCR
ncbi:SGNH/GDSL hydrolase family protein [Streptomyces sp. URMC 126]|uniref:SGNH/GDSL hydrolase family protein n=1 Tax=Streptomyces sp. URMC 126 TaxID=3423401 RepID=UPI003F1B12D6